ncbi:glutamyl endopeptidase [Fusarium beomiforme]|uniref:Serine protease n=1 Tax=Fusarium beomiforme TaxID=44412 RepID=A0A9P5DVP4_9HYPO|nr:glutamyl endopeptidase [Fusarium beomiforme]
MTFSVPGRAAAWELSLPTSSEPAESISLPDDGSKGSSESIIGDDQRQLVDPIDIQDGGKYRSIVKIQSRFQGKERSTWKIGTGWLIRPDLLVTAGNVVYDPSNGSGTADQVKCYIGYNGKQSVKTSQVQARFGSKVVTPAAWLEDDRKRVNDVAFIQIERPFTGNLRLFNYTETPRTGDNTYLGVVGYPGDQTLGDEQGAQMYEEFAKNSYDIKKSSRQMVEYSISTFAGQTGAPVLRNSDGQLRAIGTHSYGGGGFDSNSGTPIGNAYGNDYEALVSLFDQKLTFGDPGKVQIVQAQDQSRSIHRPYGRNDGYPARAVETSRFDEEGFFDVLKSVVNVGSDAFPFASSFLGPIGAPLSVVVGTLLGSLSKSRLAQDADIEVNGAAERAVLAEAALQALLASENDENVMEIFNKIGRIWQDGAPKLDTLASTITPILANCSVELLSQRTEETRNSREQFESNHSSLDVDLTESAATNGGDAFIQGLLSPTRQLAGGRDVVEWLGPVLKIAVSNSKPIASRSTSAAISALGGVSREELGIESTASSASKADEDATEILLKRAVVADAALQAVMSLPRERLGRLELATKDGEAAGIFDFIKDAIQRLGPTAVDTAKKVAIQFGPRLIDVASRKSSGLEAEGSLPRQRLKKPSMMDYLNR